MGALFANILRGRKSYRFFAIRTIINAGAKYEDAEVVVDDNFVTSRKPAIFRFSWPPLLLPLGPAVVR